MKQEECKRHYFSLKTEAKNIRAFTSIPPDFFYVMSHIYIMLLPPLGTQLEVWRKYNNYVQVELRIRLSSSSSSSHFCSIKYEPSPIDAEVYLMGLVSGQKHISLSQVFNSESD